MIKYIEEFGEYLAITAYKEVKIGRVDDFVQGLRKEIGGATVQFFDAKFVAGWEHLYFAVLNALTAFRNGFAISRTLAVEILLYAAGERQIRNAIQLIGIKSETRNIAVVILAEDQKKVVEAIRKLSSFLKAEEDESLLEIDDEKFEAIKRVFGISDLALETELEREGMEKEALKELVIEHGALIATER